MTETNQQQVLQQNKLSKRLPFSSIAITLILLLLVYFFFSGGMYKFYASILFLFYTLTKKMWVSVILLGVTQTLLLIPIRIIRVIRSDHIKEFQKSIEHIPDESLQIQQVKQEYRFGNKYFLFYLSEWIIQMTSFLTIGRLFLTDFYAYHISPAKLFKFVPYPFYPIKDVFFKIPYLAIIKTVNLGWKACIGLWLILLVIPTLIAIVQKFIQHKKTKNTKNIKIPLYQPNKYTIGSSFIYLLLSWIIVRNFPIGFKLSIFSGDVSIPNRTLNTITAVVSFGTLLWFGIKNIYRKSKVAREKGIDEKTIDDTQKKMFSESLFNSLLIGLGAYFLTNYIPSAFELSIFTLEVISLLSPITLDKFILKIKNPN